MTKGCMGVDFNNLRRKAMDSCDDVVKALNRAHEDGMDVRGIPGLEEALTELRSNVAVIGLVFKEGDPDFQDVCGDRDMEQLAWLVEEEEEDG